MKIDPRTEIRAEIMKLVKANTEPQYLRAMGDVMDILAKQYTNELEAILTRKSMQEAKSEIYHGSEIL